MELIIDEKDQLILEVLKENCTLSTSKIAKSTKIPITTVHNRIKKLEKTGVIKGYTIRIDHQKLGMRIVAYILISVDSKILKNLRISQHDLGRKLMNHPCVEESAIVAGGSDLIVKIRVHDIEELDDFVTEQLRNMEGVEKTQTMIVLHEI